MNKLLLASGNNGKIREIKALLKDLAVEIVIPGDLGLEIRVEEGGNSYLENATKKALVFTNATQLMTIADDTGLEVEALDGAPGLYSARFAPVQNPTDKDRRAYLLDKLRGFPRPWPAKFRCSVALAIPEGEVHHSEGVCAGEIIPEERGESGFGYDPIFLVNGMGKTMAEMSMDEKNRISHRARAITAIIPILRSYL
jgi:XTP/dITP diphosphohydrolase